MMVLQREEVNNQFSVQTFQNKTNHTDSTMRLVLGVAAGVAFLLLLFIKSSR